MNKVKDSVYSILNKNFAPRGKTAGDDAIARGPPFISLPRRIHCNDSLQDFDIDDRRQISLFIAPLECSGDNSQTFGMQTL